MGGFGPDGYNARTVEELFSAYLDSIDAEYGDELEPYEGSFNRALFRAFARAVSENQEQDLEQLYDSMFVTRATGRELTDLAKQYGIRRQPAVPATGVIEWSRSPADSEQVIQSGVEVETENGIGFETIESVTLLGSELDTDTNTYTTSNTSFTTKVTYTFDAAFRDTVSLGADISGDAYLRIRDDTNSVTIANTSTSTSATETVDYDISGLSEPVTIHYDIRTDDAANTAELTRAETDVPGQYGIYQDVRALEPGVSGNVGAGRVTVMVNPPPNMRSVTNPTPIGDPELTLTDGETSRQLGQRREEDDELRERVLDGSSIGGAATVRAVRDAIRSLDGTPSLTIYTNRQTDPNFNGNGLPELSMELVIYAQSVTDKDVARAIYDSVAVTERLVSGINGTANSYDIDADVLEQTWTVEWSEPNITNLEITIDVVKGSGYIGDEAVLDAIGTYIGGTLPDGSPSAGLDVSQDLVVDEMELRINELKGVIGTADITVDATGDGSDDTTTRSDGLRAYEVAPDEVINVDTTEDVTIQ